MTLAAVLFDVCFIRFSSLQVHTKDCFADTLTFVAVQYFVYVRFLVFSVCIIDENVAKSWMTCFVSGIKTFVVFPEFEANVFRKVSKKTSCDTHLTSSYDQIEFA